MRCPSGGPMTRPRCARTTCVSRPICRDPYVGAPLLTWGWGWDLRGAAVSCLLTLVSCGRGNDELGGNQKSQDCNLCLDI